MIELPEKSLAVIHVKEPELYFGHGQPPTTQKMDYFFTGHTLRRIVQEKFQSARLEHKRAFVFCGDGL